MPSGGWLRATSFYCDKFRTKLSETLFKKRVRAILVTPAGSPIGVRGFTKEDGIKRLKMLDDIFKVASLKDTALRGRVAEEFLQTWRRISKGGSLM
ncbi:MAG: hypothetical protein ACRC28_16170 [Clostridium sp.]|uniref:hypothetical protein n=1 Tax=Clostridium sp. TaxID=1506 RepID=UPI003F2F344F